MPELADLLFSVHCNRQLPQQPWICFPWLSELGRLLHKPYAVPRCPNPHLAPTLGTGFAHRHSVMQDYSLMPRASLMVFSHLQHLEKLLEVLLWVLVFFTCVLALSFLSLKIRQSSKTRTIFPDKARFLARSSSIPLNSQSANNGANTCLPSHCFLTLIYRRSVG